jgi:hypothetical protein
MFGMGWVVDIGCHGRPDLRGSACFGRSTESQSEADLSRPAVVVGGDRPYLYHQTYFHGRCSVYSHLAATYVGVHDVERGIAIGRRSCHMMIWNRGYHCGCGHVGFYHVHAESVTMIVGDVVVIASSFVHRAASLPYPRGLWRPPSAQHHPLLFECSPAHPPSAYPDKTSWTTHSRCTL